MDSLSERWCKGASSRLVNFLTVQFSSVAQLYPTLCDPTDCSMSGFPVHHQLLELAQTHVHWVGDAIQPSHPLLSPSPPAFNLSQHQGLFQWVVLHIRWPKYWKHQSLQWIFRVDSSQIDWFDFLAVQGTLKSLLQHHSSKVSILWRSAFFTGTWLNVDSENSLSYGILTCALPVCIFQFKKLPK